MFPLFSVATEEAYDQEKSLITSVITLLPLLPQIFEFFSKRPATFPFFLTNLILQTYKETENTHPMQTILFAEKHKYNQLIKTLLYL